MCKRPVGDPFDSCQRLDLDLLDYFGTIYRLVQDFKSPVGDFLAMFKGLVSLEACSDLLTTFFQPFKRLVK